MMQSTNRRFFMDDDVEQQQINRSKNISSLVSRLAILCLTTFYFGYNLVYISLLNVQTLVFLFGQIMSSPVSLGFLIGILALGVSVGSAISIFLIPKVISRRKLVLFFCFYCLVIEIVIQTPSIVVVYICRFLQGVAVGNFMALIPLYITELAPKQLTKKKNIFGVFPMLFVTIGVMTAFSFNVLLEKSHLESQVRYRLVFGVNFIAILITTICLLIGLVPESPNSLIRLKQDFEALAVISLFHKKKYVEQIYQQKIKQIERAKAGPPKVVPNKQGRRFFLTFEIPLMQQLTGVNAFSSQMGYVAISYNVDFGEFVPVIMSIVQFAATVYTMTCLVKFKRKKLLLFGSLTMALCSIGIGIAYIFKEGFPAGFWVNVFFIFIFMAVHGATLVPSVGIYVAQISRGNLPKYSAVTNWLICSATIIVYPIVNASHGYGPMFLFYGVLSVAIFILNYFIMFEQKPKQQEQQTLFAKYRRTTQIIKQVRKTQGLKQARQTQFNKQGRQTQLIKQSRHTQQIKQARHTKIKQSRKSRINQTNQTQYEDIELKNT